MGMGWSLGLMMVGWVVVKASSLLFGWVAAHHLPADGASAGFWTRVPVLYLVSGFVGLGWVSVHAFQTLV